MITMMWIAFSTPAPAAIENCGFDDPNHPNCFTDCDPFDPSGVICPEMVVIEPGKIVPRTFQMGSTESPASQPVHQVTIAYRFAVGRFPVTFAQWDACMKDRGCTGPRPSDNGWVGDDRPVINVSREQALQYVHWLNFATGKYLTSNEYRLLTEAEREYVTRAGTITRYWFGDTISTNQANFRGDAGVNRQQTVPVKFFPVNPNFPLYQVHGNVFEWVQDCWHPDYNGAPADGSAWLTGCQRQPPSQQFVLRGGCWASPPESLTSAARILGGEGRPDCHSFRVARNLNPDEP
jgi:formylglycine-generating enzyme required for sulfatase activity